MIIGLGHRKRVGKDTIAQIMAEQFQALDKPTRVVSFAEALKDAAYLIYGSFGVKRTSHYILNPEDKEEIIPILGMTYRELLIKMGISMREINANTWCYPVIHDAVARPDTITIITDIRFPNEAQMVLDSGGFLFRIDRPQVEPTDDAADIALAGWPDWHYRFMNDSANLEALRTQVMKQLVVQIATGQPYYG